MVDVVVSTFIEIFPYCCFSLHVLSYVLARDNLFMRVAFFSHSAGLYGAERSLLDLVLGLRTYGVNPVVILPRRGPLSEKLERENIEHIVYPYCWWIGRDYKVILGPYRFVVNRLSAPALAKMLSKRGIDLVYSNTLATPVGAMVAKILDIKHIWHIREFVQEDMGADFYFGTSRATRYVANTTSCDIYNSLAVESKFKSLLGNIPGLVIYNGWLVGESHSKPNRKTLESKKPIKLSIVGGVHRGKGQHEAIEALSILKKEFPQIELNIVGGGRKSYMRGLRDLCSVQKVSSSVAWSGFSSNVSIVYRSSDIILVCSRNEAFGRVVVEAMAEGCPVVGSRSGGIPEIIEHGVSGLLYKCGSVDDLARQVSLLINDSQLYSRIVREGIVDVYKRFSRQRYVEQIYQVLKSLYDERTKA